MLNCCRQQRPVSLPVPVSSPGATAERSQRLDSLLLQQENLTLRCRLRLIGINSICLVSEVWHGANSPCRFSWVERRCRPRPTNAQFTHQAARVYLRYSKVFCCSQYSHWLARRPGCKSALRASLKSSFRAIRASLAFCLLQNGRRLIFQPDDEFWRNASDILQTLTVDLLLSGFKHTNHAYFIFSLWKIRILFKYSILEYAQVWNTALFRMVAFSAIILIAQSAELRELHVWFVTGGACIYVAH